jgi:hypothetical protein
MGSFIYPNTRVTVGQSDRCVLLSLEHRRRGPPPPSLGFNDMGTDRERPGDRLRQPRPDLRYGVCFTRDPSTGHSGVYGDYLSSAQGEDVVVGIRNTVPLAELETLNPDAYAELRQAMRRLETHYRDLCDIEFTIEDGKLWVLQTRVGKRTAAAAIRVATQLVDEDLITMNEAIGRVTGAQLAKLLFPQFDTVADTELLTTGMAAPRAPPSGSRLRQRPGRGAVRGGDRGHPRAAGDEPGRPAGHDGRRRDAHRSWREDVPRGRRRPRDGEVRRRRGR